MSCIVAAVKVLTAKNLSNSIYVCSDTIVLVEEFYHLMGSNMQIPSEVHTQYPFTYYN